MKSILLKLIVSLIIVVFVPLPNPFLIGSNCYLTNIETAEIIAKSNCVPALPFVMNGSQAIIGTILYFQRLSSAYNDIQPNNTFIQYLISSLAWVVIVFIFLSIVEFTWKKLRKKY